MIDNLPSSVEEFFCEAADEHSSLEKYLAARDELTLNEWKMVLRIVEVIRDNPIQLDMP